MEYSISEIIRNRATQSVYHEEDPDFLETYHFERWVFKDPETGEIAISKGDEIRRVDSLAEYIKEPLPRLSAHENLEVAGGLRLIIQKWPESVDRWPPRSTQRPMPIRIQIDGPSPFISWLTETTRNQTGVLPLSQTSLEDLTEEFNLPRTYPDILLGGYSAPLRFEEITNDDGSTNLGLIVQSPKYQDTGVFISMALSFDVSRNITFGYLGVVEPELSLDGTDLHELDVPEKGKFDIVLECLKSEDFAFLTPHPVLLPLLALQAMSDVTKGQLEDAREALQDVRKKTDKMAENFCDETDNDRAQTQKDYKYCRDTIAKKHFDLWDEPFWFNKELAHNCVEAIEKVRGLVVARQEEATRRKNGPAGNQRGQETGTKSEEETSTKPDEKPQRLGIDESQLKEYSYYLKETVDAQEGRRERMTRQMQVRLEDLSYLTQFRLQKIDVHVSNHSTNVLTALSVISALSLPATVIASIFAMVEFFDVDKDTDQFQVSSQLKQFWFWTAPITFVVLMVLLAIIFGWFKLLWRQIRGRSDKAREGLDGWKGPNDWFHRDRERQIDAENGIEKRGLLNGEGGRRRSSARHLCCPPFGQMGRGREARRR